MCNFYIDFCVILCYNVDNGEGLLIWQHPEGRRMTMPIVYKIDILAALKEAGMALACPSHESLLWLMAANCESEANWT